MGIIFHGALGRASGAGQLGIDGKPVAVLHQHVADKAEPALLAVALAEQSGIVVGGRAVGLVGALLATEVPLRPGAGGSPEPSFGRKLFRLAHAWISVPSTEKCSSDSRPSMRASSRMAPKNLLAISPPNSRSRFLVNTVTSHTGSSMPRPTNQRNNKL